MPWVHSESVVVVVANQFNPSVISQHWLIKHGLVKEDEFILAECIFSNGLAQVRSSDFRMLVLPSQLHFVPNEDSGEQALILKKLGELINHLPHVPYQAIGLNFNWHFLPQNDDVASVTRRLFFRPESAFYQQFGAPDAHFGAYLSKDVSGFRLKLDVKPISVAKEGGPQNRILFSFNFHADFADNPATQLAEKLMLWDDTKRAAGAIVDSIEKRKL